MAKQSFLLVSLQEDKAKKLAQVVSNESCRKILDYLAEKESTETELATSLQLPISTVHYNLKQLVDAGLVLAEEFHYSEKGKEVNHYRLANKYIIIAPKSTFGIKEKLKSILPVVLIVGAAALAIQYFQKFFAYGSTTKIFTLSKQTLVRETVIQKAAESAPMMKEAASAAAPIQNAAPSAFQNITNVTTEHFLNPQLSTSTITTPAPIWQNIALWFSLGALFALLIYFIISLLRRDFSE